MHWSCYVLLFTDIVTLVSDELVIECIEIGCFHKLRPIELDCLGAVHKLLTETI